MMPAGIPPSGTAIDAALIAVAWTDAVVALGGRADTAAGTAADLVRRYAEPHRSYHTATHVVAVLRDCGALGHALVLDAAERALVALAACAHDVVYDGRPGDDERASADWARTALSAAGLTPDHVEPVALLILATSTHEAATDDTTAIVLLDADLAILASTPDEYAAYVRAVRADYAHVDDDGWRTGRAAVLHGLLDRPRLYLSEPGRAWWEAAARTNVAAELAQLAGTS